MCPRSHSSELEELEFELRHHQLSLLKITVYRWEQCLLLLILFKIYGTFIFSEGITKR